jgi:Flp pilus assembly protein TadG
MTRRFGSRRGNTAIEFVMAGIPMLMVIISIVEVSRGMWIYDTLVHSVDSVARHLVVRGYDCATYVSGCSLTVGGYSNDLASAANGLDPGKLSVTFTSSSLTTVTCNPLNSCFSNSTAWPPAADNGRNKDVWISVSYPFESALTMLTFGSSGVQFGTYKLSAKTHQQILF